MRTPAKKSARPSPKRDLQRLVPDIAGRVRAALQVQAAETARAAIAAISSAGRPGAPDPASSGAATQQASAPGQPPAARSGRLQNSIQPVDRQNEASGSEEIYAEVEATAPYAAALEFGTHKMSARPYLRPALAETKPMLVRAIRAAVTAALRRRR